MQLCSRVWFRDAVEGNEYPIIITIASDFKIFCVKKSIKGSKHDDTQGAQKKNIKN